MLQSIQNYAIFGPPYSRNVAYVVIFHCVRLNEAMTICDRRMLMVKGLKGSDFGSLSMVCEISVNNFYYMHKLLKKKQN